MNQKKANHKLKILRLLPSRVHIMVATLKLCNIILGYVRHDFIFGTASGTCGTISE